MSLIEKVQTSAACNYLWKLIQNSSEYFIVENSERQNLIYFCPFHSLTLFVNKCSKSQKQVCCIKLILKNPFKTHVNIWLLKIELQNLFLFYMLWLSLFDTAFSTPKWDTSLLTKIIYEQLI